MNEPQYTLHIAHDNTHRTFRYMQDAINLGMDINEPFTVNLISPEMVVCYWQPGMTQVAYNEYYKRWYEAQQVGLQGVMG